MSAFWDERYSRTEYIYGEDPNSFFSEQILKLKPGKIILPCEGEGRNAVFAAKLGWNVMAFDSSNAGRIKAMGLAEKYSVNIDYIIEDALNADYPENSADVVAFIFAHFEPESRIQLHKKAIKWLKPGGKIILEVFNTDQLKNNSGGPKDLALLYTEDMLIHDFAVLETELLQSIQVELSEGSFHKGKAEVVQYIGTKQQS